MQNLKLKTMGNSLTSWSIDYLVGWLLASQLTVENHLAKDVNLKLQLGTKSAINHKHKHTHCNPTRKAGSKATNDEPNKP